MTERFPGHPYQPGKYTLNVWQGSAGQLRWPVLVPAAGMLHVNISLPDGDLGN
ncbi:MAG: hypothetical protein ACRD19_14400 [Terriglobia bacterium]